MVPPYRVVSVENHPRQRQVTAENVELLKKRRHANEEIDLRNSNRRAMS
jgi:hypothetical protein